MHALDLLAYLYLAGACLVAGHLGWYMVRRIDQFEWRCSKRAVWKAFALWVLLWPVLVLRWRELLKPGEALEVARQEAARARFWERPPPCGPCIRFRPTDGCGEFVFGTADVAAWLNHGDDPQLDRSSASDTERWIAKRDYRLTQPTDVPAQVWGFDKIADAMVRKGFGVVRCLKCDAQIPPSALAYRDDDGEQMGHNFNRIVCPEGHPLLLFPTVLVDIF